MRLLVPISLALWAAMIASPAHGHSLRPSALSITPTGAQGEYRVTWSRAMVKGAPTPIELALPQQCQPKSHPIHTTTETVHTAVYDVDCGPEGVAGDTLSVEGLETVGAEVIVRFMGGTWTLSANHPSLKLAGHEGPPDAYLSMGLEHVLLGPDHLLFLLGLILIVGPRWRLMLATITAFTIAHSITLGLTIFEVFSLPRRPTEVIIALSVFLLAVEAGRQGEAKKEGEGEAELWHSPWLFALACGLLHGLGFAEGLKAVGLPPTERAWALLQFNLGIEAGQVLVVAAALAATHLTLRAAPKRAQGLRQALVYGIGATAAYWLLERVSVLGA